MGGWCLLVLGYLVSYQLGWVYRLLGGSGLF